MAEKKKKGQSQRQSEPKEDKKPQDLSPFRVVFVGATLSKCSAHRFVSFVFSSYLILIFLSTSRSWYG
jgi:hypothetical protein